VIYFSDLHVTLLKNGGQSLAVKIRKMCQPIERKGLNSKENSAWAFFIAFFPQKSCLLQVLLKENFRFIKNSKQSTEQLHAQ
jgi:hypothetical protein